MSTNENEFPLGGAEPPIVWNHNRAARCRRAVDLHCLELTNDRTCLSRAQDDQETFEILGNFLADFRHLVSECGFKFKNVRKYAKGLYMEDLEEEASGEELGIVPPREDS